MSTVVGVISDTHGLLRPEAVEALRGCSMILHAGDVGDPAVLIELAEIAPVEAVRGNVDLDGWARKHPLTRIIRIESAKLFMLHDVSMLAFDPRERGFGAVIFGHSHQPVAEQRNGVLFFNPGSAGPARFRLPITVGRLVVDGASVSGAHIKIVD
ncbi:MAG TPA: metallophosphoesterase family protein [Bryobacteraceae bacterium]|nr:metallophosphoesterase family protein [Bryobacteraceae bacterium]